MSDDALRAGVGEEKSYRHDPKKTSFCPSKWLKTQTLS